MSLQTVLTGNFLKVSLYNGIIFTCLYYLRIKTLLKISVLCAFIVITLYFLFSLKYHSMKLLYKWISAMKGILQILEAQCRNFMH